MCELGFKPEKQTLLVAKKVGYNIKAISRERVLKELRLTINGALKYKQRSTSHKQIVKYYNNLNIWQYVFNVSFNNFKISYFNKLYKVFVKNENW